MTGLKKIRSLRFEEKKALIAPASEISIRKQCALLGFNRASYYYEPCAESEESLLLMRIIDEQYTRSPATGSRQMTWHLRGQGHEVNRKRVQMCMKKMGLMAIYPKPRLTIPKEGVKKYPYLLRGSSIIGPNQAWGTDIRHLA